ncbi:hypothetical protein AGR6A_pa10005 [Agrobacterium sp. NCPPB 925]|nr:hypothetical protein AGR6A_pa10005 [Agrobacterium sp. NCPPB 925]
MRTLSPSQWVQRTEIGGFVTLEEVSRDRKFRFLEAKELI